MNAYDGPPGSDAPEPFDALVDDLETGLLSVDRSPAVQAAMAGRIVQLTVGLFDRGCLARSLSAGFEDHPTVRFIERLRRLLVLKTLLGRLTREILPRIHRKTGFDASCRYEAHPWQIRGVLEPRRTLKASPGALLLPQMVTYVSRRPERAFDTPENRLVVLTLLDVIADAERLLRLPGLHPEEARLLQDGRRDGRRLLRYGLFHRLVEEVERIRAGQNGRTTRDRLEQEARQRIDTRRRSVHDGYRDLLAWRRQYEDLSLVRAGTEAIPMARAVTPERGYELLVLLEVLLRLGRHGRVQQTGDLSPPARRPARPVFVCRFFDGDGWEIYFQSAHPVRDHRRVRPLVGIPDLVIRNPATGRLLLGDAKLYTATSYGGALFKMMGYLYQFGYPDAFDRVAGGALFLPDRVGQESGWAVWAGEGDYRNQIVTTLTIPVHGLLDRDGERACDRWIDHTRRLLRQRV
jgi:hypothetical protein